MSGHVVVAVEACHADPGMVKCKWGLRRGDCDGCVGDGTRAVLDSAVPVERPDGHGDVLDAADAGRAWVEVQS